MSELLFLGTGAADWTKEHKGDFFRRFSAALLNQELLLDCTHDIFDFAESIRDEHLFDKVTDIMITHCHSDHFNREAVLKLAEMQKIRVGCDRHIRKVLGEHPNITYKIFRPYVRKKIGKYQVTPVLANHDVVIKGDRCAFHYIIEAPDGKKLFYGLDGAWYLRPTWAEMKQHQFALMVFDCTVGDSDDWRLFEHNTIPMLRKMTKEIRAQKMLQKDGKLIASHLARTLHGSHEETVAILQKLHMITAFDGMTIHF